MALKRTRLPYVVTGFPARAIEITPSDVNPLMDYNSVPVHMTVYVGQSGDVAVVPVGNDPSEIVTFYCPTGGLVPVEVTHVRFTGTTATGLVGMF